MLLQAPFECVWREYVRQQYFGVTNRPISNSLITAKLGLLKEVLGISPMALQFGCKRSECHAPSPLLGAVCQSLLLVSQSENLERDRKETQTI